MTRRPPTTVRAVTVALATCLSAAPAAASADSLDPDPPRSPTARAALAGAGSHGTGGRRLLPGTVNAAASAAPRARPAAARSTERDTLTFRVYLEQPRRAEAEAFATAVSTPGHPQYRRFLRADQFHRRFSPSAATATHVSAWLRSQGFAVRPVPANRRFVEASGTVARAETAFATRLEARRLDGRASRVVTTQPSVPAALGGVQTVVGLDDSQTSARPTVRADRGPLPAAPAGARDARPCSRYWGERTTSNTPSPDGTSLPTSPGVYAPCGYTPAQLRRAYELDHGPAASHAGAGVEVGVLGVMSSDTLAQDVAEWSRRQGLRPLRPGQLSSTVSAPRPGDGALEPAELEQWAVEQTMDIQAVRAIAPAAGLRYYGARDSAAALDALLNDVVDRNDVDVLSNSYSYPGEIVPRATMEAIRDIHVQAAAQGMTVLYAAGDSGDQSHGSKDPSRASPDWPASSPFATAVGGTSLGVGRSGRRLFELAWETGMSGLGQNLGKVVWSNPAYVFGSGGGTSRVFASPSYQKGVVPNALSTAGGARTAPMRTVPDVSAVGDPSTGMVVGQTLSWGDGTTSYGEFRSGGTSLAAPVFAGILARVGDAAGGRLGLANPVLYSLRHKARDIEPRTADEPVGLVRSDYRNSADAAGGYLYTAWTFDHHAPLTIHTRDDYDDTTGVGSPGGPSWFGGLVRAASRAKTPPIG